MIFKVGDMVRAKRTTQAIGDIDRLDGFSGSPGYPQPGTVYQVSWVQPDVSEPLVALVGGFGGPFFASRFEPVENSLFALLLPDSQP